LVNEVTGREALVNYSCQVKDQVWTLLRLCTGSKVSQRRTNEMRAVALLVVLNDLMALGRKQRRDGRMIFCFDSVLAVLVERLSRCFYF
jgi:hypothetical protein